MVEIKQCTIEPSNDNKERLSHKHPSELRKTLLKKEQKARSSQDDSDIDETGNESFPASDPPARY